MGVCVGCISLDGVSLVVLDAELILLDPTPLDDVDEDTDERTTSGLPFVFV